MRMTIQNGPSCVLLPDRGLMLVTKKADRHCQLSQATKQARLRILIVPDQASAKLSLRLEREFGSGFPVSKVKRQSQLNTERTQQ